MTGVSHTMTGLGTLALALFALGGLGCESDLNEVRPGAVEDGGEDAGFWDLSVDPVDSGIEGPPDVMTSTVVDPSDPSILARSFVSIRSVKLWVTIRGQADSTKPPMIIIPTGPGLGHEYLFEPTAFLLGPGGRAAPDRLLVYFDPRATGRSETGSLLDPEVTVERHLSDLAGVLDYVDEYLGSPQTYDLLGHGYGAGLAALLAEQTPERVHRLILSNPFPSNIQEHADWIAESLARMSLSERERYVQVTDFRTCLRDLTLCERDSWAIAGPTWFCEDNRDVFRDMNFIHVDYASFGFYIGRDLRESEYDWKPVLAQIPSGIPTTVIAGPCDPIPASAPQTYFEAISDAKLEIVPGSGHFTMTEQADHFETIVLDALSPSE